MSVAEILQVLNIEPRDGVAVALNDSVVSKNALENTTVHEGDRLEIIRAVAGG